MATYAVAGTGFERGAMDGIGWYILVGGFVSLVFTAYRIVSELKIANSLSERKNALLENAFEQLVAVHSIDTEIRTEIRQLNKNVVELGRLMVSEEAREESRRSFEKWRELENFMVGDSKSPPG
jgi:hypothetical protein